MTHSLLQVGPGRRLARLLTNNRTARIANRRRRQKADARAALLPLPMDGTKKGSGCKFWEVMACGNDSLERQQQVRFDLCPAGCHRFELSDMGFVWVEISFSTKILGSHVSWGDLTSRISFSSRRESLKTRQAVERQYWKGQFLNR